MADKDEANPASPEADPRQEVIQIAESLAPLVRRARARGFGFLAYLLAMALKESRRLAGH